VRFELELGSDSLNGSLRLRLADSAARRPMQLTILV
jgi:hypothetical protein